MSNLPSNSPSAPVPEEPPPAPPPPRRIPCDRTRAAIRYTLEDLPRPTSWRKHTRIAALSSDHLDELLRRRIQRQDADYLADLEGRIRDQDRDEARQTERCER